MLLGDRYRFLFGYPHTFLCITVGYKSPIEAMRRCPKGADLCYLIDADTTEILGVADPKEYICGYIKLALKDLPRLRRTYSYNDLASEGHYQVFACQFFKDVYSAYGEAIFEAEENVFKIGLANYIKRVSHEDLQIPVRRQP